MDRHFTAVGVLDLALGVGGVIGAPLVLISMVGGGLITGQWIQMLFVPTLGVAIASLILLLSIPTLVGGIGLLCRTPWGRSAGLFAAAVNLVSFPIGTPIGAYGLWALIRRSGEGDARPLSASHHVTDRSTFSACTAERC